jgi:predicted RNA-binding Zn-ribbon protein involved in translation (DUF1610 family)
MKIVCAWCNQEVGEKEGEGTTHTLCPACKQKYYPEVFSRYEDPTLVRCEECGWQGPIKECRHGHASYPISTRGNDYDVEPMDYCPKCDSDQLVPLEVVNA